ncbi:MAG: hypothetical protein GY762_24150 [Proteobacteria bacterium]|nr:hypothetical protein [Pseudomonadota bacterium]
MGLFKFLKSLLEDQPDLKTTQDEETKAGQEYDHQHDVEDLVMLEYARRSMGSSDEYDDTDDDDLDDDDLWF